MADAAFRSHPVNAHSLKGQIGHHCIDIMGQGLIHLEIDFLPCLHL